MFKKGLGLVFICVIFFFICVISASAEEETLTITTYYPSPYGNYREMRAQRIAIGDDYIQGGTGGYCWPDEVPCTNQIDANADLLVQGSVGIETLTPNGYLQIGSAATAITLGTWTDPVSGSCPSGTAFVDRNGSGGFPEPGECQTGNVGIGITNPQARLNIAGASGEFLHVQRAEEGPGEPHLRFRKSRGSLSSPSSVQDGDWLGAVTFDGYQNADWRTGAVIYGGTDGDPSGNFTPGRITFYTGNSTGGPRERMRINSSGNVGIGTTNPTAKLHIGGTAGTDGIRFPDGTLQTTAGGGWTDDGTVVRLTTSTDNVGIGTTSPTAKLEVACPDGFTNIKAGNNQLGCMQNTYSDRVGWWNATNACFTSYGGRLPFYNEWYIAVSNYAIREESDQAWEWVAETIYDDESNTIYQMRVGGMGFKSVRSDSGSGWYYRCWLPR